MPPSPVRLAVDPPANASSNFGRDEALHAAAATTGAVLLRVYGWSEPTVSFGRHEKALARYDAARLTAAGLTATRRITGGRALVHSAELTYAVAGPVEAGRSLTATVRIINEVLSAALQSLGVPAVLAAPDGPAVPLDAGACFGAPSAGELMLGGRKLAGSAQWRDGAAWLQHGSVLISDDQPRLRAGLRDGIAAMPVPAAATLGSLPGGAPSREAFADALATAWSAAFDVAVERVPSSVLVDPAAVAAHSARYADPAWIWRR